jgi:CBS domain-containing protein
LDPHQRDAERAHQQMQRISSVAPYEMGQSELLTQWTSLFSSAAIETSCQPVETIMEPIRGTVSADDPLSTVINAMLQHRIDLIPVVDGTAVVGVILMTDVFDIVAQFIMEQGGQTTDPC